ncbi:MAG: class I SAM-dependent methyltransferase [Chthonomonadales bacterium]|nr:class I SAM-dependent methyltransferase [Chthonomonadales bacterium]
MSTGNQNVSDRRETETAEAAHWDSVANRHREAFVARERQTTNDPLHDAHINAMGDIGDDLVLDLGCGMGLWATEYAAAGARVVALDVSSASVATTRERARRLGLEDRLLPVVASAHALPFRHRTFHAVSGHLILHHLDAETAGRELARILQPNGKAVFTENSARSGILMFARRFLCGRFGIPKWSTPDEYPLRKSDVVALTRPFATMEALYPKFDWFFLLNAKLFGFRNNRMNRLCGWLDRTIPAILPFLRRYAYYQVLILRR